MFYNIGRTSQIKEDGNLNTKRIWISRCKNVSQSAIDKATLCLDFIRDPKLPGQVTCYAGSEEFTIALQPGHSTKIGWSKVFTFEGNPATGSFTDIGTAIVVSLVFLKYSNGMLADLGSFGVVIGQGIIPSSRMLSEGSGCGTPKEMSDRISEPRILDISQFLDLFNASIGNFSPGSSGIITVIIEVVVDSKGSVCSASILNSRGLETDPRWIERLKKTTWFPATEGGVPVTVRFVKSLPIQYNVRRFN